ncbi:Degenerin del-1 [Caenorhabditis elegans]|uniref:Degenerin del-1 n=1 Tax=Caenorhabditis elegans TaxID=6239 RepID=A0A3B1DQL6_CAEEL|nr:Degenerin del-1 [Caenorhabditis elegans]VAY52606.1 Degenerin del-1 [Caenorhabditis elegans]|eukprot:NP_001355470.1 Degenerin del-1 [Caenorhabditis elegans]
MLDCATIKKRFTKSPYSIFTLSSDVGKSFEDDSPCKEEAPKTQIQHSVRDFCEQTTFHGVNMIFTTSLYWVRFLWVVVSLVCICLCMYSFSHVKDKYDRKEKIVNVELVFESAPFPAITVCNLNPFKNHLARSVPEISETLDAFHQAVVYSNDATMDELSGRGRRSLNDGPSFKYLQYEPVYSDCSCVPGRQECIAQTSAPRTLENACICNYDRHDGSAWPCYSAQTWEKSICPECNDIGFCNVPNTTGSGNIPCYCQLEMGYCVFQPESRVRRIWEFQGNKIPEKGSPLRKEYMEQLTQLGYGNMTDQVAITTQAKEKMILKMSGLHPQRRAALGYGKSELIKMCSFNGQQCNIDTEFKLHIDPSFGNCYTFNANPEKKLASSRAGPSYGLRLMMFVNSSDYLPTTEATGVRIAIHGKEECPFPDTFGYSAPTGVISSFGISLRNINRLPQPYGNCLQKDNPQSRSIYKGYKYEPEGCFRSCYQYRIIAKCGCADPRYPKPWKRSAWCDSTNTTTLNCLTTEGAKLSTKENQKHCKCIQPCQQDQYTTTYSAAKWPSGSIQTSCDNHSKDCNSYLREHAAMIEIYYEQMSYEILRESESYSWFNLMADMGGQAGLFLGASIMSVIEFLFFAVRTLGIACKPRRWRQKTELLRAEELNDAEKGVSTNNN